MALPRDTRFFYLAEGAANIVYRIHVPVMRNATPPPGLIENYHDDEPQPTDLDFTPTWLQPRENLLLRVRKNLSTTIPCEVSHDAWLRLIAPIFSPDQVVQQSLVELRPGNVIEQLNEELREWEEHEHDPPTRGSICSINLRPSKRRGVYLADDEHGLLIQDMTPQTITDTVVEFKPKWLVQSPSAPKFAKRCRQCAFTARHNAQRLRTGKLPIKAVCPLDLVSKSQRDRLVAAQLILSPPQPSHAALMRMTKWLETNTLLDRLRACQDLLDKRGPLISDVDDEDFLLAMTLRDCTVFMRFRGDVDDPNSKIEARIGDLDLKSKDKKQYWVNTEKSLIDEGWYMGMEAQDQWQPLTCQLSPKRNVVRAGARRNNSC